MSAQRTPGQLKGRSANMSIAQAKRADARARAELRLSPAQLRLMQSACPRGAIEGWRASHATFRALLARGLINQPHVNYAADATQFFYITEAGHIAVAAAIAKATGNAP